MIENILTIVINLMILGINIKLYTEMLKDRNMERRANK